MALNFFPRDGGGRVKSKNMYHFVANQVNISNFNFKSSDFLDLLVKKGVLAPNPLNTALTTTSSQTYFTQVLLFDAIANLDKINNETTPRALPCLLTVTSYNFGGNESTLQKCCHPG